jgi:GNAT superfamily N-acetyltransferase
MALPTEPQIRRAQPEEANHLRALAIASKGYWGYSEEWLARWASLLHLPAAYVRDNDVFVGTVGAKIVGFYALIVRRPIAILDHLWVAPEQIGQGIGRALFRHALDRTEDLGATGLEIEAEPHAMGFYARMGARHVRDTLSDMGRVLPIMAVDAPWPRD